VPATLLLAAHGTRSPAGSRTTAALAEAVARRRPGTDVSLCFLDVADPPLAAALDSLADRPVVVVPLLLSAGYHVLTDLPAVVAGRHDVAVARHLGPDPAIIAAVAERLEAAGGRTGSVLLAAIASSRSSARADVDEAAAALAARLGRPVTVAPLGSELGAVLDAVPGSLDVATYLLAEGGFLDDLRELVGSRGVVADPIGGHPALIELIWQRYDEAEAVRGVR
jgi:sirohydrochlorin ferrochelatase